MDTGEPEALEAALAAADKEINALAEARSHVRNAAKGLAGEGAWGQQGEGRGRALASSAK
jgi:signal recognition particle subunit SRP68